MVIRLKCFYDTDFADCFDTDCTDLRLTNID